MARANINLKTAIEIDTSSFENDLAVVILKRLQGKEKELVERVERIVSDRIYSAVIQEFQQQIGQVMRAALDAAMKECDAQAQINAAVRDRLKFEFPNTKPEVQA